MLNFRVATDQDSGEQYLETALTGKPLLTTPQLNKGTAFSNQERREFGLIGKLPPRVETLEEQAERAIKQYYAYTSRLRRNIYLNSLLETSHVLFYKLVGEHIGEMMPTIYTPIVGTAVKHFSGEYRRPRGLYITYDDADHIDEILDNRSNPEIDVIVVSDGEGVLGIGDQGIGAMDIPVAKLMVYTLCGGIDPSRTLPIMLDVGTNNQELLDDPLYLGWRHERVRGQDYDDFIDKFVSGVKRKFPNVFLHWEDFGRENARHNLERYQDKICTFNDDMQGTGVVTLSAMLAAVRSSGSNLLDQRIVVFGAGTAGTGIADQICDAFCHEGLSPEEARRHFWMVDRPGLLMEDLSTLTNYQAPYARTRADIEGWQFVSEDEIGLLDVVKNVEPTILIGCSAQGGAFSEEIVRLMASKCERPIILPLSNPTEKAEATPSDLLAWTDGRVHIATGSPFEPVEFSDGHVTIAQCNNAFVFPGIGLGIIAAKATRLTTEMLWQACVALSECAPINEDPSAALLPDLEDAKKAAEHIAIRVAEQARKEGVAGIPEQVDIEQAVQANIWHPHYLPYKKCHPGPSDQVAE